MAERRMFAKSIVFSDAFLDMPLTARCLYFSLGMVADDDGFVNNYRSIIRQIGASIDDLKLLIAKSYIICFEDGVIVIKHWRINNYLQNDRHKDTKYTEDLSSLSVKENGAYHIENAKQSEPCIQNVYNMYTQDSIGKLSKDKESKDKYINNNNRKDCKETQKNFYPDNEKLNNAFLDYMEMRKKIRKPMTDRAIELAKSTLAKLSNGDNDTAIAILNQSIMNSWQGLFPLKDQPKQKELSGLDYLASQIRGDA